MVSRTDHPALTVEVEAVPAPVLAERRLRRYAARRREEEFLHLGIVGPRNVPFVERIAERRAMHRRQVRVEQHRALELAEERQDPARAADGPPWQVTLRRSALPKDRTAQPQT